MLEQALQKRERVRGDRGPLRERSELQHPFQGTVFQAAKQARRSLTALEARFYAEAKSRGPSLRWRRYAPVTIRPFADGGPCTWYAPFLCLPKSLIVILEDRPDFPYRIYGQAGVTLSNLRSLYERHGYTVLDFSEDFSCEADDSVWDAAMVTLDDVIRGQQQAT